LWDAIRAVFYNKNAVDSLFSNIKKGKYTDYHFIKPHKNNMYLKEITEASALCP
jgi:hypothetical protein